MYCFQNYSVFALEYSKSIGWRPSFQYYNKYLSLLGAILCLLVMFLIEYGAALATLGLGFLVYQYITFKDPNVNWGSVTDSRRFYNTYQKVLKLRHTQQHVKN